ncbi:hypothetical protein [Rhizobium lentis]|nr:hypothetical protein [Rhizobium lentis]
MKSHPQATKKQIVRAAFYALIAQDPEMAGILQEFATTQRADEIE